MLNILAASVGQTLTSNEMGTTLSYTHSSVSIFHMNLIFWVHKICIFILFYSVGLVK